MTTINHESRAHALLSASGSSRWINCTPSARLEEKQQESKTSIFAEEGTLAHEFAGMWLLYKGLNGLSDKVFNTELKKLKKHALYSPEMDVEVAKYVDYVLETYNVAKAKTKDAVLMCEQSIDYSHIVEKGKGTGDAGVIGDGTMDVIDLKYGKGLQVDAENNTQLMLYGIGMLYKYEMLYDIQTVRLTIVQPRLDHISVWEISADDLRKWGEEVVKPKASQAYAGEGEQVAGSWCKFCKVKGMCKALAEENTKLAAYDFKDPHLLTKPEILAVFNQIPMLVDWANSVGDHILQTAIKGEKWEGLKLVEGRSNRKWTDETKVISILDSRGHKQDEYINAKLKGLTEIEKLVSKGVFNSVFNKYTLKPPGAPTLVPESDKRPELNSDVQAANDFAN